MVIMLSGIFDRKMILNVFLYVFLNVVVVVERIEFVSFGILVIVIGILIVFLMIVEMRIGKFVGE